MDEPGASFVDLEINGAAHRVLAQDRLSLLGFLRNALGLNGPKYGCGLGQCGACTVLIEGKAARACVIPVSSLSGLSVVTLEGLAEGEKLHPVQDAVIANSATQCGYCLNGMIMTLAALFKINAAPADAEIREALRYNLCRCGSHLEILKAAQSAASKAAAGL